MNKHPLFLAALLSSAATTPVDAAPVYWDTNAESPGAGSPPNGDWASSAFWSSDPAGMVAVTTAWTPDDTAFFSAGTDATDTFTVSGNATTAGINVEEGGLTVSGTITLGTGPVNVNAGASLITNHSLRIGASVGSVYTLDGGKLETTNTGNAGSFVDTDSTIVLAAGGGTIAYSGTVLNIINFNTTTNPTGTTISGPGSLTKTGSGVIAIATACTYAGTTTVSEGELRIRTSANRLPITTAATVNAPGILNLNTVSQRVGSLSGNGTVGLANATLTVGDATSFAFNGVIKDTANYGAGGSGTVGGSVTKVGAGTLTLTGLNAHTTLTTLSAGGITVDPGASLSGTANLTVNGGTLNLNNAAQTIKALAGTGGTINLGTGHTLTSDPLTSTSCASTITGPGGLTRLNTDITKRILTLTGSSSYSGPTLINGGTLQVDGALTASPVTVNTGGTLGGGGTLGAAVAVASGGAVAPGASAGTLNFGSTLTFDSGSFYNVEITGAAAADKVNVTGTLTANGTVKVTLSGYVPVAGNTFDIADAASITGTPTFDFSSAVLTAGLTWDTSLFASTGVIKVSGGSDPFVAWAASFGLTGGKADDDDKDGAINLLEFATNSNPKTAGDGARTYGKLHLLGGDSVLTLTVATRSGASFSGAVQQTATKDNVIYTVQGSDTLTDWNSVVITELNAADSAAVQASLSLPTLDAGWEWHTFRTDGGTATDPRDFIRLLVAAQP